MQESEPVRDAPVFHHQAVLEAAHVHDVHLYRLARAGVAASRHHSRPHLLSVRHDIFDGQRETLDLASGGPDLAFEDFGAGEAGGRQILVL